MDEAPCFLSHSPSLSTAHCMSKSSLFQTCAATSSRVSLELETKQLTSQLGERTVSRFAYFLLEQLKSRSSPCYLLTQISYEPASALGVRYW